MQKSKRLSFSIRYFMTTVWRSKPEKKNRIHKFLSTFLEKEYVHTLNIIAIKNDENKSCAPRTNTLKSLSIFCNEIFWYSVDNFGRTYEKKNLRCIFDQCSIYILQFWMPSLKLKY